MVGHILHFDPRYAMPLAAAKRGEIGQIIHVYARRNNPVSSARKFQGKTTVLQFLGIHDIEFVLDLVDDRPVRVSAEANRRVLTDLGVDDTVFTLVKFASGAIASFEHSWALPGQPYRYLDARLDALGSEGVIRIDCAAPASQVTSGGQMLNVDYAYGPLLGEHYSGAIYHQIAHFVDCVVHKRTPLVRLDTAHLAVRVVAAAQESLRTGSPVGLS